MCLPSHKEWTSRAKSAFNAVRDGQYFHHDVAKYQIYRQGLSFDSKKLLTRSDVYDIHQRISQDNYFGAVVAVPIEDINVHHLADYMQDFVRGAEYAKIEYMISGKYKVTTSPGYDKMFLDGDSILEIARKQSIPPKMVDTCGFNQLDMAYRVWSESVYMPGVVIAYTGPAMWGDTRVCWTTMRVLSDVADHDSIITITILSRE